MAAFGVKPDGRMRLNDSAALVFRDLQRGTPAAEITQTLTTPGLANPLESERWMCTIAIIVGRDFTSYARSYHAAGRCSSSDRLVLD
jgi:hypothetical protein